MSDSRPRPGAPRPPAAPRAAPPVPAAAQISPRPPPVAAKPSPPAPPVKPKIQSEPPETGWDDAPTATSLPEDDDPITPQRPPPVIVNDPAPGSVTKPMSVPPPRPASVPPPRMASTPPPPVVTAKAGSIPPAPITPVSLPTGLSASAREEVWAIVRAAVDEAIKPLVTKQRELEAKLAEAAKAKPAPVSAAAPATVPMGLAATPAAPPVVAAVPRASIPVVVSGSMRPRQGSIPPTGFGVAVIEAPKPEIDLAAIAKIPIEMEGAFDGGRRKRRLGKIVIGLLLAGVVTVIVLAILSHGGG